MKSGFLFSSGSTVSKVDFSSLILRFVVASSLFYGHGLGKFNKIISGEITEFVNLFGIGMKPTYGLVTFAEFICAGLVVIGLFTRIALIPLIITMAYIVFVIHWEDGFDSIELPAIYLAVFVALLLIGPGKHSFDNLIYRRKSTI